MVRGGVYEQFRGALLGFLWGLECQSPAQVPQYLQQWQEKSLTAQEWSGVLPHILAAWQQPLVTLPPALEATQLLIYDYLERAWQPQSLAKPVASLAATPDTVTRVKYALAIAPRNLLLAQQLVQEPDALPLLGCLFGAYWGALALPLTIVDTWHRALEPILAGVMQQWSGGQRPSLTVAPAGWLRPYPHRAN